MEICTIWMAIFFFSCKSDIDDISNTLSDHGNFYPHIKDIYNAFILTPLESLKVIILGQDPYHGKELFGPQAMGLSFSVRPGFTIPVSLKNIFKELSTTIKGFQIPKSGDLIYWALQGVLLLNTALTVKPGVPGSHIDVWSGFTIKLLTYIVEKTTGIIFILWGDKAKNAVKSLNLKKHYIITSTHPSGYSANMGTNSFIGSDPFNKTNEILESIGKDPIDWNLPC